MGVGLAVWYYRRGASDPKTHKPSEDSAKPSQQAPIQDEPAPNLKAQRVQAQRNQTPAESKQSVQPVGGEQDIQAIPEIQTI